MSAHHPETWQPSWSSKCPQILKYVHNVYWAWNSSGWLKDLTHSLLGIFSEKLPFNASPAVFWSLSGYKELKLTTKLFTCRSYSWQLLVQMQNISFWSLGMCRKQNFEIISSILGLKVTQQSYFFSLSSFFFFRFSSLSDFFSFAGHSVGFILVGKVIRKAFRIRMGGYGQFRENELSWPGQILRFGSWWLSGYCYWKWKKWRSERECNE